MQAITVKNPGDASSLQLEEHSTPSPGPEEVLLEVSAVGVNRADVLQRRGAYPPPPGVTEILGLECSGRIVALGEGVEGWQQGDTACALVSGGAYATHVSAPASALLPVPKGVSVEHAAALPEAAATVWLSLVHTAQLHPMQTLLLYGGSGGVGTLGIQMARVMGARVFTTARGDKRERCELLGAERAIDYTTEDVAEVLHAEADGADVIHDILGAGALNQNLKALADGGRCVTVGLQKGRRGEMGLDVLMHKRAHLTGVQLRSSSAAVKAEILAELRENIWPLIDAGVINPVVDSAFALADAEQAHERVLSGDAFGKVLLVT